MEMRNVMINLPNVVVSIGYSRMKAYFFLPEAFFSSMEI